jgi:two-component system, LuxR family, sensor kinase FixL
VPAIVADTLVEIDEGVVRAGEIVRRLRALVERGDIDRKFENVPELIRESCGIGLVDAKLRGIDLHFEFDPQALSVFVDRIQIQQVLVNLLRNAVDAMADSKIRQIVISTKLTGVFCEIGLQDSGPGIDEDVRQRLFAPFNTSKQSGLGIGLSICRTIIEAHGGQIWCDDAIKNGTKFRLQLPVGEAEEITTL